MYIEFVLFVAFVLFSIQDFRKRQIKAYWFVGLAGMVLLYKTLYDPSSFVSDGMMFLTSALFTLIAFASKLFAKADLFGILILSFAVPMIGPIPTGIPLLILTLTIQNWAIILTNVAYNISDCFKDRTLFQDVPNVQKGKTHLLYWFFLARRRRDNDRFIMSAERYDDKNGAVQLSIKRNNNNLSDSTKYVFSTHPQFVFSTIAYSCLWFVSLSF